MSLDEQSCLVVTAIRRARRLRLDGYHFADFVCRLDGRYEPDRSCLWRQSGRRAEHNCIKRLPVRSGSPISQIRGGIPLFCSGQTSLRDGA